jgi:Calcineurin-like phosphoesterase
MKLFFIYLSFTLITSLSLAAKVTEPVKTNTLQFEAELSKNDTTVYAIGDIHGDLNILKKMVYATGVVDQKMKSWLKPKAHLVLTGDYIDRGPDTRQVIDFLIQLQNIKKNKIHVLTGNHERMRLLGFNSDAPKEDEKFLTTLFNEEPYSGFIKSLPVLKKVGPFVFMHGGIDLDTVQIKNYGFTRFNEAAAKNVEVIISFLNKNPNFLNDTDKAKFKEKINNRVSKIYEKDKDLNNTLELYLWGKNSPLWTRSMANVTSATDTWIAGEGPCFENCDFFKDTKLTADGVLTQFLDSVAAQRLVLGHTIQSDRKNMVSHSILKDKLSLIDVSNSSFYDKDKPGAFIELDIKKNKATAFEVDRKTGKKTKI